MRRFEINELFKAEKERFRKGRGRKLKKPILSSQALLLQFLWRKHGGPSRIAQLCGVAVQHPNNWRMRGKVPLKSCKRVATAINESIWALNYKELSRIYSDDSVPTWSAVVKACFLDPPDEKQVLSLKAPN